MFRDVSIYVQPKRILKLFQENRKPSQMNLYIQKLHGNPTKSLFFLLILALWVSVSGCKSDAEKKIAHYEKGTVCADKKDFKSAVIEFKNAIQIDPKFEKAHAAIADAYLADANPKGAYTALLAATELNPDNIEAQMKLATLLFLAKEYDRSRERVDIVLTKDPKHAEAMYLSAGLSEQAKDFTSAETLYRAIVDAHPANIAARVSYSRILGRLGKNSEQEKILLEGVSLNPKEPSMYLSVYAFYIGQKKFEKAERILTEGIAALPKNTDLYATLGYFHASMKQPEKAEAIFKKTIDVAPDTSQPYRVLANFYRQEGKHDAAIQVLESVLPSHPEDMEMRIDLAHVYLSTQQANKAKAIVDEIQKNRPDYAPAKLVRSEILVSEKDFDKALEILNPFVQSQPDNAQAVFLRAMSHLGKKQMNLAKSDAAKALELNSGLLPARRLLAEIYYGEKSFDLAQKEFEKVLERNPRDREAAIKYGNSLFFIKDAKKAQEVYQQHIEHYPKDAEGYFRMGVLEMRQRNFSEAEKHLAHGRQLSPERADIVLELTMLYAGQKKFQQAIDLCDQQIKLYADQKPLSAMMLKTKGDLLAANRESGKAHEAYEAAIAQNPDFPATYFSLAKLFLDGNETEKAISQYQIVLGKNPASVPAHMMIGTLYQTKGQLGLAEEHYRKALSANAEFAPAANNLAYLLADQDRNLDEALSLAQKVKEKIPENPFAMDTLGWAYYKKGLYDFAIAEFSDALEKTADQPMIHYHLAMAYHKKGENEKAKGHFKKALDLNATFEAAGEARRMLAEI